MSSTPTRRDVLKGLASAVAAAVSPTLASAEVTDASKISSVYQAITTQAFNATYGETLSPNNISDLNGLLTALSGTADAYRENLIVAAEEYVSVLGTDDQQKVLDGLNWKPLTLGRVGDNLISDFIRDEQEYLNGGRTYEINPLFAAIHTLGQEEKITTLEANTFIKAAREMVYPEDHTTNTFHSALVERVKAVIETTPTVAPATPGAPAPSPFE